jgi:hypothetical protein
VPSNAKNGYNCVVCGKFVDGFEYEFCCGGMQSGYGCGCMGQPLFPCTCSQECADNWKPPLAKQSEIVELDDSFPF